MIKVESLSKHYGAVCAVNNISFAVNDGEITGLLGPNGAGKTSILRMLHGLLQPSAGNIWVDNMNIAQQPELARKRLGVLPDDTGLYKRLTARENIEFFGRLHNLSKEKIHSTMQQLASTLHMDNIIDRRAQGFSLGERMKTALARSIIHQPQNILLDEPTNGLDVLTTRAVRHLLWQLRDEGRCVLFSSHLMNEVAGLCDRVIIIVGGKILADGTVEEIQRQAGEDNLEEAFVRLAYAENAIDV